MKRHTDWQSFFTLGRDWYRMGHIGWHTVVFGIIKIKSFPPEGETLSKKYYRGFIIRFAFWFPIDLV